MSWGGIRQRLGQLRARPSKRLSGGQQIPGGGLQASQGVRIFRAGLDHLGKGVTDLIQAARQSGTGRLKCPQLFQQSRPFRCPLELFIRLL